MRKFFRSPPTDDLLFVDLFRIVWDQGVGNTALTGGRCGQPWHEDSLSDAIEVVGGRVSETTIGNWRAGKLPLRRNIYFLTRAISNDTHFDAWRDAFFRAVALQEASSKAPKSSDKRSPPAESPPATEQGPRGVVTLPGASSPELPEGFVPAPSQPARPWGPLVVPALLIAFGVFGIVRSSAPKVSEIRVCDAQSFSVANQACSRNIEKFPEGTTRVYVSFDIQNYPQEKPFTRTWFHNGQEVRRRNGTLAPPWDGWTWYGSADPYGPGAVPIIRGNYTLRVTAGDALRTATFQVGTGTALKAGDRFRDPFLDGRSEGPEMIVLPAGHFVKGSPEFEPGRRKDEGVRHSVTINYAFAVTPGEITWDEWMACVEDGGCNGYVPDGRDGKPGNYPVVNVSYNDIFAYTHWLNRRLGIAPERFDRYTLLTESEWEFAALAGTQGGSLNPYSSGETLSTEEAHFGQPANTGSPLVGRSFAANPWGLYDMLGNVAERVEDCYRPFHDKTIDDGSAYLEAVCVNRLVKGGSYADPPENLRAAARRPVLPEDRLPDVGFRLARRIEPRED